MADKNFRTESNPTSYFLSAEDQQPDYTPPVGYKLVPETKSEKLHLLITPRLKADLTSTAKKQGISVNALVNNILFEYLEGGKE